MAIGNAAQTSAHTPDRRSAKPPEAHTACTHWALRWCNEVERERWEGRQEKRQEGWG